jgi:hypothetical protein
MRRARHYSVTQDLSMFILIRSDNKTFNRLAGDESVHNLWDIRGANAPVKKVIGFD